MFRFLQSSAKSRTFERGKTMKGWAKKMIWFFGLMLFEFLDSLVNVPLDYSIYPEGVVMV